MTGPQFAADGSLDLGRLARRITLFVVFAVVGVLVLATMPGIGEVRERVSDANPWWLLVAAVCAVGSTLGFVVALWGAFDRVVPWRVAVDLGFAEQGANVLLPAGGAGGPAFGTFVMRHAGVPTAYAAERHAALFLVTSSVGLAALTVFGTIGLAIGHPAFTLALVPLVIGAGGTLLALGFASTRVPAQPARGRLRMLVWRLWQFLHGGVRTSLRLLVHGDRTLAIGAVAYYAFDVASLGAAFQALGGGAPTMATFVLAYTVGHAGAFVPTPGGVGGVDGGLIGSFVLYGASLPTATAAVLAYRIFQLGVPIVLGAIGLLRIRAQLGDESERARIAARYADF
jgi:uncharacterized membrane protein YbhN (UPF0104 family)